jgi:hypothetical protein
VTVSIGTATSGFGVNEGLCAFGGGVGVIQSSAGGAGRSSGLFVLRFGVGKGRPAFALGGLGTKIYQILYSRQSTKETYSISIEQSARIYWRSMVLL